MQNITKKDPTQSSVHSTSPCIVNSPLWWNSIGSQIPQSSLSKSLTLRMDSPPQHCIVKQFGQLQEQDSSSTQSTGQSQHDVAAMGEGNPHRQCISAQSGFVENYRKQTEGHLKSVASLGNPNFAFPSSQIDYSPSMVRIPYPCADPHVNGLLAVYGPQAIIHPQMVGMTPARIPLPLDLAEDEPIYVNAKQYHAILRRRQCRANFEAQNKLAKARKPYLHESRHRHALNRVRGSGGRFLNTKKLQQSKPSATIEGGMNALDSAHLQLGGNMSESEVLQSENGSGGASATSSDVTSVSNGDDIFQQPDTSFSTYPPRHMSRTMHGGAAIMCNGSQHRVSVMR